MPSTTILPPSTCGTHESPGMGTGMSATWSSYHVNPEVMVSRWPSPGLCGSLPSAPDSPFPFHHNNPIFSALEAPFSASLAVSDRLATSLITGCLWEISPYKVVLLLLIFLKTNYRNKKRLRTITTSLGNLQRLQNLTVLLVIQLDCIPASRPEGLYQRKGGMLPEACVSQSWGYISGFLPKVTSSRGRPQSTHLISLSSFKVPSFKVLPHLWKSRFPGRGHWSPVTLYTNILGPQVRHMGQSQLVLFISHHKWTSGDVHMNVQTNPLLDGSC